jgi:glycosyltransferase involved in cell wall biosynthesis
MVRRLRVLVSAYACEPAKGSEPGVGWRIAREMARDHEVWVLTRANNRPSIVAALDREPIPGLRFVYYDLDPRARWWKRGPRGVHLYYYLWQIGAYFVARRLHRSTTFDLVHHVTFGKYWAPSFLALLPVPFVWGPVGGAESVPKPLWRSFTLRGRTYEILRDVGRWCGEHDPFVRLTARRSALALAKTGETANRLRRLGAKTVCLFSEAGLPASELNGLAEHALPNRDPVRFISIGTLLQLKGFHLGLRAFALADLGDAEYWIIGDGPERRDLEALACELGIGNKVRFWGWLHREETLRKLGAGHVLVHPSLHESGGWVCVEAMAAGRPVICLNLGGPSAQLTEHTGIKVQAHDPDQVVRDLAAAMSRLAHSPELRQAMGKAGRQWVSETFCWEHKGKQLGTMYRHATVT